MDIQRLYHTLKHLRREQWVYRLTDPLRKKLYIAPAIPPAALNAAKSFSQHACYTIPPHDRYEAGTGMFTFLNKSASYGGKTDWNDTRHGMLWAYHLNYFYWLGDESIPVTERLQTVKEYSAASGTLKIGLDSYPISLRGTAWICFFITNGIKDAGLLNLLFQHCHRLWCFPEYALGGNHLWENGCALVIAGHYFGEPSFYNKGAAILEKALDEQVAPDGAHVEGSPAYHSLLLYRLLRVIEVIKISGRFRHERLFALTTEKAGLMAGWLVQMTFSDGSWPQVNDSAPEMAPSTADLLAFAEKLGIPTLTKPLSSGYHLVRQPAYELFMDTADILPSWQPGHAHADTFTFCLHAAGRPVIADTGISTYEANAVRQMERGTGAHNTVSVDGLNSSDVWKSFRVGRRARIISIEEKPGMLIASHDGYRELGIIHRRSFLWQEKIIIIEDTLEHIKKRNAFLFLHFHPDISVSSTGDNKFIAGPVRITIEGAQSITLEPYSFAAGFNNKGSALRLKAKIGAHTKTIIELQP